MEEFFDAILIFETITGFHTFLTFHKVMLGGCTFFGVFAFYNIGGKLNQ
jgi:hypothetical protein